ncbi:MAG: hypothetical protein HUU21_04055 [Polyangiaceae bacterium]|nr:hypothetical protein [Polyangiaceae bacterium]
MDFFRLNNPWLWVALAVLVLAIVAVLVVLHLRKKKAGGDGAKTESAAKSTPSLAHVYKDFLNKLPASARADPVLILLGERLSGKTSFLRAAIDPAGRAGLFLPSETGDNRLQLFAGGRRIIQELSGELLVSSQPETRSELLDLWRPIALRAPVVVIVVRAGGPSFTPAGLRELGTLARGKIDCLTELRGRPVRVRVCVTHLDREAPGFVDLALAVEREGSAGSLRGVRTDPEAGAVELGEYLPLGVKSGPVTAFAAMTDFVVSRNTALFTALRPLFQALLDARGTQPAPVLDQVMLAAFPDGAAPIMTGDPLAIDVKEVESEATALTKRRRRQAIEVFAAAAALSVLPYLHYMTIHVGGTKKSVAAFEAKAAEFEAKAAKDGAPKFPPSAEVHAAEEVAAGDVKGLMYPFWPQVRYSFSDDKDALRQRYLERFRASYLNPVLIRPNRLDRASAAAVLYAEVENREGNFSELGLKVTNDAAVLAARIGIPEKVIRDYVAVNDASTAKLPADLPDLPVMPEAGMPQWLEFLQKMQEVGDSWRNWPAGLDEETFKALRRQAIGLGDALAEATAAQALKDVIAILEREREAEMRDLIGPKAPSRAVPEWVVTNRDDLSQVLDLARNVSLAVEPAAGKGLNQALTDLEGITPANAPKPSYRFLPPESKELTIDAASVAASIAALRSSLYVIAFMDDARNRQFPAFFARNAYYPSAGGALVPGRGASVMLPGVYTKAAFDRDVAPALSDVDTRLDKMSLLSADRRSLIDFIDKETRRYSISLRDSLKIYYASFRFNPTSVSALRADVNDMLAPSSWFSDFLLTVAQSAGVDTLKNPRLQPLGEALSEFQPIVAIMTNDNGKFPALEKYTAILGTMLPSLDAGAPGASAPRGTPLEERLAPIGKLAFTMLVKSKASVLDEVKAFLDGAGVPTSMRSPFLAPVNLAYSFGMGNIEEEVARAYAQEVLPEIQPLFDKFPFDSTSTTDASGEEVTSVLVPEKGTFWTAFQGAVAPVCNGGQNGVYTPKSSPYGSVRVPAGALSLAKWAGQLGKILWEKDGKPKPLTLSAKPLPLPAMEAEETVTLSYIRAGSASVYGFNQSPAFQSLPAAWSPGEPASVGMEVTTTGGGDKQFASIDVEGSDFAILRLLKKGTTGQARVWTWVLSAGGAVGRKYAISFEFAADPFAPFRPPAAAR